MDDNLTNAPRSKSGGTAKLIGILVILILAVMILLLATGVVNFEDRSLYGS